MADPMIYRYEVPVDDRWHTLELTGTILHIAARQPDVVEAWAVAHNDPPYSLDLRVFVTGQPLPEPVLSGRTQGRLCHVDTTLAAGGKLVWHLFAWLEGSDGGGPR